MKIRILFSNEKYKMIDYVFSNGKPYRLPSLHFMSTYFNL